MNVNFHVPLLSVPLVKLLMLVINPLAPKLPSLFWRRKTFFVPMIWNLVIEFQLISVSLLSVDDSH